MVLSLLLFCGYRTLVWQALSSAPERQLSDILQRSGKQALIGIGLGHLKENTPDALDYPGSDFEQFEPEGVECGSSQLGPSKAAAQVPQQNEGKSVQQQPKLVCLKPGATQPVGFEMKFDTTLRASSY